MAYEHNGVKFLSGLGYPSAPMMTQSILIGLNAGLAKSIIKNAKPDEVISVWAYVATMTPDQFAKTCGLSVQEAIDRVHESFRKFTSNLGCDADPTGSNSPVIVWNEGKGFTHPTLDSRSILNLMHHLGHTPKPTDQDYSAAPVIYGRPALLQAATKVNPIAVATADDSLFAGIPFGE